MGARVDILRMDPEAKSRAEIPGGKESDFPLKYNRVIDQQIPPGLYTKATHFRSFFCILNRKSLA